MQGDGAAGRSSAVDSRTKKHEKCSSNHPERPNNSFVQGASSLIAVAKKVAAVTAVGLAATGATLAGAAASSAQAAPRVAHVKFSLSKSIAPAPKFLVTGICGLRGPSNSTVCDEAIIKAIDAARRSEPLHGVSSSFRLAAFKKLSYAEQLFTIADIERTARGLAPIAGLTSQLRRLALSAAAGQRDPAASLPLRLAGGGVATYYGSNWAEGTANPLGADYFWMYDDGPNSPNGDCPRAGAAGCWGHRENVLGAYNNRAYCPSGLKINMVMGAGEVTARVAFAPSIAEIFVNDCGSLPSMYFTWSDVQRLVFGR